MSKNQPELKWVPVAECRLLERNPQTVSPSQMAALKRSIARNGFLAPILVRRVGDGYEIVSGNHRYLAAVELGFETVPAVVADLSAAQARVLAVNLNLIHGDPTAEQLAPYLGDIPADLLREVHLEGDLLRRVLDFDRTLATHLAELTAPPAFSHPPPASSTTTCVCPACGRQHMKGKSQVRKSASPKSDTELSERDPA